jgi:hypothetical protein
VQLYGQRVPHRRAHLALDCPRWRRPDGEVPEHYETCVWRAKRRTSNKHRRNVPVYSPVVLGATLAPLLSWRFCSGMTLSHTRAGVKRRWSATRLPGVGAIQQGRARNVASARAMQARVTRAEAGDFMARFLAAPQVECD